MNIKEYSLSIPLKKQLGYIIRESRIKKFNENKNDNLIEINPYTKENFCDNNTTCHYHTLTKLENDYIREDNIYHILLSKLGLYFQLEEEEHLENMKNLLELAKKLLQAIEYLDDDLKQSLKNQINSLDFTNDCLADLTLDLLKLTFESFLEHHLNLDSLNKIEMYILLFEGLFEAIAIHTLGYNYYLLRDYDKAEVNCLQAIKLYQENEISLGISYLPLVDIYIESNNYYEAIKLCNILEEYYFQNNNKTRLLSVYIHLSDYYLLINSKDFAQKYYDEAVFLAKGDPTQNYMMFLLHNTWGLYELTSLRNKEALNNFELADHYCVNPQDKLLIINRLLICNTILKLDIEKIKSLVDDGLQVLNYGNQLEQLIFNYFVYKMDQKDYKHYALEKIMPLLKVKDMLNYKIILLFFYEDFED